MSKLKSYNNNRKEILVTKELLEDYSEKTTIHGIRYIGDKNRPTFERLFWLITIILSILVCSIFIKSLIDNLEAKPVIVTFAEKSWSTIKIPFPSVTICPRNKFRRDLINITKLTEMIDRNETNYQKNWNIIQDLAGQVCSLGDNLKFKDKLQFTGYDVDYWLPKYAVNMNETLINCFFKNYEKMQCELLFRKIYTESGLCYNYNGLYPDDLYRDTSVFKSVNFSRSFKGHWSPENGYNDKLAVSDNWPQNSFGGLFGGALTILLNLKMEDIEPLCSVYTGFKIILHSPVDQPFTRGNFISIPLNTDVRISVSPRLVYTTIDLKKYSPEKRGCYMSDERKLKYFKIYSENNCWIECLTNFTLDMCGCVFFYMPRYSSDKVCGIASTKCLQLAINLTQNSPFDKRSKFQCYCLPSCNQYAYDAETSFAQMAYGGNKIRTAAMDGLSNEYLNNSVLSTIEIFYKTTEFIPIRRTAQYTITSLVADCGGVLGLFMGFSLISLAEIIYYCTIRPFILCYRRKRINVNANVTNKPNQVTILEVKEINKMHSDNNIARTMETINRLPIEFQYYYN